MLKTETRVADLNSCLFEIFLSLSATVCVHALCLAQTVLAPGGPLHDYAGEYQPDSFRIAVKNLPNKIDATFGLAKVCVNITHPRVSDLKIELRSPDGASIWLSNRNGGDSGWGYSNTCFRSNGFNGYVHEATPPFEGEYIPDGRFVFLNNGQNPNGDWFLLVHDLRVEKTGSLHLVSLEFGSNPMPNMGLSPCSFENPAACQCLDGGKKCTLLPDFIVLSRFTTEQIKEYAWNDPYYPGQLRFAASIANVGDGPLETRGRGEWFCGGMSADSASRCPDGSRPRQKIYQRVYELDGEHLQWQDVLVGTNYFDDKPGHDHFHADNWVEFRLVKISKKSFWRRCRKVLVSKAQKISYCLFDSGICQSADSLCRLGAVNFGQHNLPNYGLGNYSDCNSGVQGISVGGYDTYGLLYEGQFVYLPKNLPVGEYFLEIEIDPDRRYREKNKKNNVFSISVRISKQMGQ